jgi:hypothetical protein
MEKRAVHGIFVKPRYTHLINAATPGDTHNRRGHYPVSRALRPSFVSAP